VRCERGEVKHGDGDGDINLLNSQTVFGACCAGVALVCWEGGAEDVRAGVPDAKSFRPVKPLSIPGVNEAVVVAEGNSSKSQSVSAVFVHSRTTP
jgi:hypothetical protein